MPRRHRGHGYGRHRDGGPTDLSRRWPEAVTSGASIASSIPRAYLSAMDGELYHYHDMTGLDAGAVAVATDGRWGAFEVKTSPRG